MHLRGILEAAQTLRLLGNDALRGFLVVRSAGQQLTSNYSRLGFPCNINVGIKVNIFEVVADTARATRIKQSEFRVHCYIGVVEGGNWVG